MTLGVFRSRKVFISILAAFWFSVLFLPFKGIYASAVLFAVLIAALPVYMSIAGKAGRIRLPKMSWDIASVPVRYRLTVLLPVFVLPVIATDYIIDVMIMSGIYIILAIGLNVVVGFAGLLNLGFVAYYAVGAYSYALLNTKLGIGFWTAMPLCLTLTTATGFFFAVPALRLKGDYLALVTLGFGEIVRLVLNNWDRLTNGPNGVSGIAPPGLGPFVIDRLSHYYYLVLFFVVVAISVTLRVRDSRIGRAWISIREDETASMAMGVNTTLYKLYACSFGSFWAGIAGCLFAAKMRFVSPESFSFMESVLILCMVILGGLGSIAGVIVGAFVLVMLPEALREVQMYRMLALGIGLVFLMLFRPQGLFGGKGASS